jgi:hypothetical protein
MGRNLTFGLAAAIASTAAYLWNRWEQDKPRPDERERIAYPPLDTPKVVRENIWIVDSGPMKAGGLSLPIRMTIIRLTDGGLWLHSPTPLTDSVTTELERLGPVSYLVAPTLAHWTFLPEWQRAFPGAEVWAVPSLKSRAQVRASGLRIDHEIGERPPEAWVEEIDQGIVRGGAGFQEAWFLHRKSRTLVLTDLIQNLEPAKLPPVTAALAVLSRAASGRTAAHVRVATALGGAEAKEQVRRLVSLEPERVIFAHGSWFESKGAERLRRAFSWFV